MGAFTRPGFERMDQAWEPEELQWPSDWDLKVIMDSVGGPQFDSGPRWMLPFARAVLARYGGSTSNPTEA
jgi:hypothetical protein